jgi:hypothetical protein
MRGAAIGPLWLSAVVYRMVAGSGIPAATTLRHVIELGSVCAVRAPGIVA